MRNCICLQQSKSGAQKLLFTSHGRLLASVRGHMTGQADMRVTSCPVAAVAPAPPASQAAGREEAILASEKTCVHTSAQRHLRCSRQLESASYLYRNYHVGAVKWFYFNLRPKVKVF